MYIKQIDIDHYGMFHGVSFDLLSPGLQVFYGMNEAGKSTLMRFIEEVLFGFSSRSPAISDGGAAYGGRLTLDVPGMGTVMVERKGNKGKGTARLYFDDGRTAGEEKLNELLQGLDAKMFRAIFSFGLDGLQGLENIKADELNDYLFHAGMTGDFSIRELEKKLEKKQDALFKPSGRKPLLNQQLTELERLEKDNNEWQKKIDGYQQLHKKSETIQQRMETITKIKEDDRKEIRSLERQKVLAPYIEEQREWQLRLEHLPEYEPFPEEGLSRFENWHLKKVELEAQRAELRAKRQSAVEKSDKIDINNEWLSLSEDVNRKREQEHFLQEKQNDKAAYAGTVRTEDEELVVVLEKLGSPWTQESVMQADTGLAAKQELRSLIQEREHCIQRQRLLEDERSRKEQALKESRTEKEQLTAKRLTDSQRSEIEEQIRQRDKLDRKAELEDQVVHDQMGKKQRNVIFYGGLAFAVILAIWLILGGQWIAGIVAATLIFTFSFYLRRNMIQPSSTDSRRELSKLQEELNRSKTTISIGDYEQAKLKLAKDEDLRQSEILMSVRLAQEEKAHEDLVDQKRDINQTITGFNNQIMTWCDTRHFPGNLKPESISETFEWVEEAKQRTRKRDRAKEAYHKIDTELQKHEDTIKALCEKFHIDFENSTTAVERMSVQVEEEQEKLKQQNQLQDNVRGFDGQIQSLQNKINRYQNECQSLMKQAETEDEDAYRRKGKAWQESRDILEKLSSLQTRIEALVPDESERTAFTAAILERDINEVAEISRLEGEINQLEEEERGLHGELADLVSQMNQLEEGRTYAELFHRFEQNKDRFRSEARRWAVYHTAAHLLKKSKERYRNERLPKVIEAASQYFKRMSGGRYPVLFSPTNEGFVVERTDGKRFSPKQLSRGTVEQLYLSIRLALARIYQSRSPYPLIMDDILVNFDAKRAEKALDAVRDTAENHQVLLFTCHHHLLQHFHDQEIIPIEQGRDTPLPMS